MGNSKIDFEVLITYKENPRALRDRQKTEKTERANIIIQQQHKV